MHRRGWTYFRVMGEINGEEVSGEGRIPFVYAACKQHHPWLRLQLAESLKIVDSVAGACVYDAGERVLTTYPAGSFFKGLARPWMGLHTIDLLRRDAAQQRLRFETKHTPSSAKTQVILTEQPRRLIYTINLERDVIEKITFLVNDGQSWNRQAELGFSYLQELDGISDEFVEPRRKSYGIPQQEEMGMLWLLRLAEDNLC